MLSTCLDHRNFLPAVLMQKRNCNNTRGRERSDLVKRVCLNNGGKGFVKPLRARPDSSRGGIHETLPPPDIMGKTIVFYDQVTPSGIGKSVTVTGCHSKSSKDLTVKAQASV